MSEEYRSRTQSTGTLPTDGATSTQIFTKSRKTHRSPTLKRKASEAMEEEIIEMLKDIKTEMREIRRDNEQLKEEIRDNNKKMTTVIQELQAEVAEMRQRENEWKTEKDEIKKKIEKLENREEDRERRNRKNNIVITGIEIAQENMIENVKQFIKQDLGVEIGVTETYTVGKEKGTRMIIAKINSWEEKQEIMHNKGKLKGRKIYVNHDLTVRERNIQRKLRDIAKENTEQGRRTQVAYKKIKIEGKWFSWNETEEKLTEIKDFLQTEKK